MTNPPWLLLPGCSLGEVMPHGHHGRRARSNYRNGSLLTEPAQFVRGGTDRIAGEDCDKSHGDVNEKLMTHRFIRSR
jgi:hypothetical protein